MRKDLWTGSTNRGRNSWFFKIDVSTLKICVDVMLKGWIKAPNSQSYLIRMPRRDKSSFSIDGLKQNLETKMNNQHPISMLNKMQLSFKMCFSDKKAINSNMSINPICRLINFRMKMLRKYKKMKMYKMMMLSMIKIVQQTKRYLRRQMSSFKRKISILIRWDVRFISKRSLMKT